MSEPRPQRKERDINRWAVEVMRGVARALRREAGAAEATPRLPEALERAA